MSEFILFHVFGPLKTKENNKKFFLHNSISKIKESRILYIIFFFLKNNDEGDIYRGIVCNMVHYDKTIVKIKNIYIYKFYSVSYFY